MLFSFFGIIYLSSRIFLFWKTDFFMKNSGKIRINML